MNNNVVTTGLVPLTINSTEVFELRADLDGVPWNLVGGSGTLKLADPTGSVTTITATVGNGFATAPWTVVGPAGEWLMAWDLTDSSGVRQVTRPIPLAVQSSPV